MNDLQPGPDEAAMKERALILAGWEVRAFDEGRKTQRRVPTGRNDPSEYRLRLSNKPPSEPGDLYRVKEAALRLRVVSVRAERLQDISEQGTIAEGIRYEEGSYELTWFTPAARGQRRRKDFTQRWDERYAKKGLGWDVPQWVWVETLEVVR